MSTSTWTRRAQKDVHGAKSLPRQRWFSRLADRSGVAEHNGCEPSLLVPEDMTVEHPRTCDDDYGMLSKPSI